MREKGSITKQGDAWRVRISIGGKRRSLGLTPTHADAEALLRATIAQIEGVRGKLRRGKTLRQVSSDWLDARELDGFHRDVSKDRACFGNMILQYEWADEPVKNITRRDVKAWVSDRIRDGYARQSILNGLNLLRSCLDYAEDANVIQANPAIGIKVKRLARTKPVRTMLSAKDVQKVFNSPKIPERSRLIFKIAVFTGLRPGELCGLHWSDVDLASDPPRITVRYSRNKPTKTGKPREVTLIPQAVEAFKEWRRIEAAYVKWRNGVSSLLVFPSASGGCHALGYDGGWKKYRGEIGMEGVRFYDFRHTCASMMLNGTLTGTAFTKDQIQQWLGHASVTTTEIYTHHNPDTLHRVVSGHLSGHGAARQKKRTPNARRI